MEFVMMIQKTQHERERDKDSSETATACVEQTILEGSIDLREEIEMIIIHKKHK
jgi:hypothetical protein